MEGKVKQAATEAAVKAWQSISRQETAFGDEGNSKKTKKKKSLFKMSQKWQENHNVPDIFPLLQNGNVQCVG